MRRCPRPSRFRHKPWRVWPEIGSTVFAVEEVAHGAAAGGVDFELGTALCVVGGAARLGLGGFFRLAAGGAAIGEAGLAGMELELLVANDAGFDRERHAEIF